MVIDERLNWPMLYLARERGKRKRRRKKAFFGG